MCDNGLLWLEDVQQRKKRKKKRLGFWLKKKERDG